MTTKDKTVFRHFVKFYMLLLSTTKPGEFRVENLQCLFPLVGHFFRLGPRTITQSL